VYLDLGITTDCRLNVLGLRIDPNEGAKLWLLIVNELRNCGIKDILIAAVAGLSSGFTSLGAINSRRIGGRPAPRSMVTDGSV
jgi:putative transposase